MNKLKYRRGAAFLMSCLLAVGACFSSQPSLFSIVSYADERAATVNATNLNVRSGPGTSYPSVAKLSYGTSVTVTGEQNAADGVVWYQIRFNSGGADTTGFASSAYIKFPTAVAHDGDFESYMNSQGFPESYKPGLRELHAQYPQWTFTAMQTNLDWNTVIQNESVIGRNLVGRDNISSWKSTAAGAYDWDTGTWPGFDGNSWVQASEDIIRYYMDPRNFLNDKYVFQFLKQSYDSSTQTKAGLEAMVSGTFLAGTAVGGMGVPGGQGSTANSGGSTNPGGSSDNNSGATGPGAVGPGTETTAPSSPLSPVASVVSHPVNLVTTAYGPGMGSNSGFSSGQSSSESQGSAPVSGSASYVDIIMNAAAQSGVSPYILASMIIQEQGSQGTGRSISGTVSGYEGYYNFFNVEAYQSGSLGAVERGLWWASQAGSYERPWNSVEKSILGGAIFYGNNYVKKGQDTLYLKKFNVQGQNLYKHQYMTNVLAAAAEGQSLAKISALKSTALEFSIPVYKNMPDSACAKPTGDGSPNNKLSGLGVDGFALTPTFNRDTESYDLIVDPSVANVTVAATAIDSSATVSGTGTVNLQSGINDVTIAVKAGNGSVRNYVLHIVRQANGPTYSAGTGGVSGGGGSNGTGPGGSGPGGAGPGSSTGGTEVVIKDPPGTNGTNSGSATPETTASSGPIAPDGSNMNGFGTEEHPSNLVGPGGNTGSNTSPNTGSNTSPNGGAPSSGTDGGYRKVSPGTTAAQAAAEILSSFSGSIAKVYTASGGEVSGSVGTGNLLQVYGNDGSRMARYELVVKGDNTGDGKLNILDILKVQRHILGLETMTGAYEKASDVNGNNKIDIMDILAMQRDVLGIQKLQ